MKKLLLMVLFILTTITFAKSPAPVHFNVDGQVIDSLTNIPIEFANIVVQKSNSSEIYAGTTADKNGHFKFDNLAEGQYKIRITFTGYAPKVIKDVKISDKEINLGQVQLTQSSIKLSEVEVKAQKPMVEFLVDKQVVNVDKVPAAASGSIIDVLKQTPAVTVDKDNNVSMKSKSSVTILIDGKPTLTDQKQLEQMPASMVDKIEVITNPSAKYEAEGNGGIINIVMKKNDSENINGNVRIGGSNIGHRNASFNMNYKKSNFNLFSNFYIYKWVYDGDVTDKTWKYKDSTKTTLDYARISNGSVDNGGNGLGGKIGFDYNFTDNTSFTLMGQYLKSKYHNNKLGHNVDLDNSNKITKDYNVDFYNSNNSDEYRVSGFFKQKFNDKGHELTSDMMFVSGTLYNNNDGTTHVLLLNNIIKDSSLIMTNARDTKNKQGIFKLDYSNPLSEKTKLEAGYNANFRLRELELTQTNSSIPNINSNNIFKYTELIQSLYGTYSGEASIFKYQIGLRMENTYAKGEPENTPNFKKQYTSLFPNANISMPLDSSSQLIFSYSRRINRPYINAINPFLIMSNKDEGWQGNPKIDPSYTNNYEINFNTSKGINYLNIKGYYSYTKDNFEDVPIFINKETQINTYGNFLDTKTFGAELNGALELSKWWNINASISYSHNKNSGSYSKEDLNYNSDNWNFNLNNNFNLPWEIDGSLGMFFTPKTTSSRNQSGNQLFSYMSLVKSLMDRKLKITFSINDLFSSPSWSGTTYGSNFNNYYNFTSKNSPMLFLTISYSINDYRPMQERNLDDGRGGNSGGEGNNGGK